MSREFTIHPAANLFPKMGRIEFETLKEDIRKNGLRSAIVFWRGQLIDGRHRIEACEELGINWENFAEEAGADQDPVAEALSLNLHRRHLSPSQLAMVADKVRGIYDTEGKAAKTEGGKAGAKVAGNGRRRDVANVPQGKKTGKKSRDKAAEAVGVSGKLADAAKKVRSKGTAKLQQAVESGDVSVTAAAIVADLPSDEQEAAVSSDTVKEAASNIRDEKKRAAAAAKGADEVAVKALMAAANPLCVIEKVIAKFSQEQITALYIRCEELLEKVK